MGHEEDWSPLDEDDDSGPAGVFLSKEELEQAAKNFRADLGLSAEERLDSLQIKVDDVTVISVGQLEGLDGRTVRRLQEKAAS